MPHAENGSGTALVNGERKNFQVVDHVASYPAISKSVEAFKSNPYGARSLELATNLQKTLVDPVIPYAEGPYSYVAPYVAKADSMADDGLKRVDERFPIVKSETEDIKNSVLSLVFMPLRVGKSVNEYVWAVWGNEYKKCGGDGYVAGGKAVITTGLVVTSDTLGWISEMLRQKGEEGKQKVQKVQKEAQKKMS
ncbi:hypothetical protein MMC25_008066 [Agyrium rufum]|nr:hypothetical protein [Agyrium rufum]